jgi:hypothetical protein
MWQWLMWQHESQRDLLVDASPLGNGTGRKDFPEGNGGASSKAGSGRRGVLTCVGFAK